MRYESEYLRVSQVAAMTGDSPSQVKILIAQGTLRATRNNPANPRSMWLVDAESVKEFQRTRNAALTGPVAA